MKNKIENAKYFTNAYRNWINEITKIYPIKENINFGTSIPEYTDSLLNIE